MPYSDPDRQRQARRESARRRRSAGSTGSTLRVEPPHAQSGVQVRPPGAAEPRAVEPAGRAGLLLDVVLDELMLVRSAGADPLVRGRVVAQLVGVALAATRDVETETKLAEITRTVERLKAERDQHGPRRLRA